MPTASTARRARRRCSPPSGRPIAAIKRRSRRCKPGDVLVLCCRGPMGAGMEEIYQVTSALKYLPWGKHVAVLTDARFCGVSTGACIGHVGPEALAGGPIGKLRDGDRVRIVIDRKRLEGSVDLVGDAGAAVDAGRRGRESWRRASRGRTWRPTRRCRTTRGCGRRCSTPAAASGAAACTMWRRSWGGCPNWIWRERTGLAQRHRMATTARLPSESSLSRQLRLFASGCCRLLSRALKYHSRYCGFSCNRSG